MLWLKHAEDIREFMRVTTSATRDGYLNRLRVLMRYDIRDRLQELRMPTLFLAAELDHLVPSVTQARFMAARVPGAKVRVLPVTGTSVSSHQASISAASWMSGADRLAQTRSYNLRVPVGTPFHERTFALCTSLNYRDWSGYYTVSSYEAHHDHEYNAIRNAAALIDISPLFKYHVEGPAAARLVNRVITRDVAAMSVGQVYYTPWCDEQGFVIDDGTVARLAEQRFRWTAAEPNLRWLTQNAAGLNVAIDDVSEPIAALALQGPLAAGVLRSCADVEIDALRYFRITSAHIDGVDVDISRTGYTGDLGYEIWMPRRSAVAVWDALMRAGRAFGLKPAGMLALDVARVEAGLLLIDVDFVGSRKAMTADQRYTPDELGLGRMVSLDKGPFIGRAAICAERERGVRRRVVGLEIEWSDVEELYERVGLAPVAPSAASRVAVPVRRHGQQIGRATTTTWSPPLKRLIALATLDAAHADAGTRVEFEVTIEAARHFVGAQVVPTPFFNPGRKTATPPV